MKKILSMFLLMFLISCNETISPDPYIRASEQEKIIEQSKIDTLNTLIENDDNYYVIKQQKVTDVIPFAGIFFVTGFLFGLWASHKD